jgi:hypothetical protein
LGRDNISHDIEIILLLHGNISNVIAPHGCCSGYEQNFDTINEKNK